ncbi:MAG: 50S ribosomal protein L4 [Planctomycetota bacterium]|nr:MAG: 50S ribosomal protein L4 [Planctomycetota bacterium]
MANPTQVTSWDNGKLGQAKLDASSLGDRVKLRLLWDAVRMYEANKRQGTVSTKTRAETNYTTRKPYKQKGTGNARRGDFNSPLLRGGGVIFGPRPRDYSYSLPRKALREALRSALIGKLRDDEVLHLSSSAFDKPSTKTAAEALRVLGVDGSAALVVPDINENVYLSFRNLPRTHVMRATDLNGYDVLWHRRVVFVDNAWDVLIERLAGGAAAVEAGSPSSEQPTEQEAEA